MNIDQPLFVQQEGMTLENKTMCTNVVVYVHGNSGYHLMLVQRRVHTLSPVQLPTRGKQITVANNLYALVIQQLLSRRF